MPTPSAHRPLPKRWRIAHKIPRDIHQALDDFSPLMRQLLYNRGFEDNEPAGRFIQGEVAASTDPNLLKTMEKAVERLRQAVTAKERVAVYGDYDVDGVTSTALLVEFLSLLGLKARAYIPNRFDEGYGLNKEALQTLAEEGQDLVITVDCGVRSVEEVAYANQQGLDVIISDHHQPAEKLPPAIAVINPKQDGDPYPEKSLAGVGLAYKLVQAYLMAHPQDGLRAENWLDLVAVGTVADLAPLQGENRTLVKQGLTRIRRHPRQGLFSLAQVAGMKLDQCEASNIGFMLGPRLNAAGRLDSALTAFDLLMSREVFEAGRLAQELDVQNRQRQDLTRRIQELAAEKVLEEDPAAFLFFAADPDFNEGVVGLAASRLVETYYRPAVIAHAGEDFTVASCRSIPEFHITKALDACADLLERHGGHAAAAGFTVRNENRDALVARLKAIAEEQLVGMDLRPEMHIDREIKLDKLSYDYIPGILEDLNLLEPTGYGNPEPIFASRGVEIRQARLVGREGKHLKLLLRAGPHHFDAIAFRQGYWMEELPEAIDIAYRFEVNEYMGRTSLQLNIRDIKPSEG
jgi:single-stranded-DNA-specific exonuclease